MASLLRTRMIEDLRIRNYARIRSRSTSAALRRSRSTSVSLRRSLNEGHIRDYQLYLAEEKKSSWTFYNQSVSALRFLYRKTLKKDWSMEHIPFPKIGKFIGVHHRPARIFPTRIGLCGPI